MLRVLASMSFSLYTMCSCVNKILPPRVAILLISVYIFWVLAIAYVDAEAGTNYKYS